VSGPVVFVLPGASLMRLSLLDGGLVRVACPGCGAVQTYRPRAGRADHRPFIHAFSNCPTLAQIDRAALTVQEPERIQ
jgi:predicted RNA-binding Zn-ribbon protein involved in translation (DUF1610 family)